MDDRGIWHNRPTDEVDKIKEMFSGDEANHGNRPRYVISFDIGATVEVARGDDKMLCIFEAADKNKVTLKPIDEAGKPRPYLELAERVRLSDGASEGVVAQVWDNRNGKIVLRTLPVSSATAV